MKSCISRAAPRLLVLTVVGAIGLTAPASVGFAQAKKGGESKTAAAASKPDSVSGVVVEGPPKLHNRIPPAKRAAFDAEAANRKAWTKYRATAAPAPAPKGPGASPQTENYPGLRKLGSR